MAYMDQDKKAKIAAELKKVIPKDWKYSLSVRHHCSIALTISAAPVDIIGELNEAHCKKSKRTQEPYRPINDGHVQLGSRIADDDFPAGSQIYPVLDAALQALKAAGWYDRSESQIDHFDTAYYFEIRIGRWNKPFALLGMQTS